VRPLDELQNVLIDVNPEHYACSFILFWSLWVAYFIRSVLGIFITACFDHSNYNYFKYFLKHNFLLFALIQKISGQNIWITGLRISLAKHIKEEFGLQLENDWYLIASIKIQIICHRHDESLAYQTIQVCSEKSLAFHFKF